jgi:hypothetical protein
MVIMMTGDEDNYNNNNNYYYYYYYDRLEVPTAVTMKRCVLRYITQCSPANVNWCFGTFIASILKAKQQVKQETTLKTVAFFLNVSFILRP